MTLAWLARRHGFGWALPVALALGLALRLAADESIGLPFVRSPVLVQQLTPGLCVLMLGWTLHDRWSGCRFAVVRPRWVPVAVRNAGTALTTLGACALAVAGRPAHDEIWVAAWFLAGALLVHGLGSAYWWVPVLVLQFVLLRLTSASALGLALRQPAPAVAVFGTALVATVLLARQTEVRRT